MRIVHWSAFSFVSVLEEVGVVLPDIEVCALRAAVRAGWSVERHFAEPKPSLAAAISINLGKIQLQTQDC